MLVRALGGAQGQMVGIKGGPVVEEVDKPEVGNLALDRNAFGENTRISKHSMAVLSYAKRFRNRGTLLLISKNAKDNEMLRTSLWCPYARYQHSSRRRRLSPVSRTTQRNLRGHIQYL
jgi:hypothetical protein